MTRATVTDIESSVARCRVILSVTALAALAIGSTQLWRFDTRFHEFAPHALGVLLAHLAYSVVLYYAVTRRVVAHALLDNVSAWSDMLFSAVIAYSTLGTDTPFYAFFGFAVVAVGFRSGLQRTLMVTTAGIALYVGLILVSSVASVDVYVVRVAGLAILGYLVGYMGQRRLKLEDEIRDLAGAEQRARVARELHDGCVQALAAVKLKLEGCKEFVKHGHTERLLAELGDLQANVTSEHDDLRAYMRSLAGVDVRPDGRSRQTEPWLTISAEFSGSGALVDQVLQIIREGATNIRRHARAQSGTIKVQAAGSQVFIAIDDNGVGFPNGAKPWSISSRVNELGGRMRLAEYTGGGHLVISVAQT